MTSAVGLAVTLRTRLGAGTADRPGGFVDPARILSLFSDVAGELMIRMDGDEGILRSYQQLEFLAPILVGDYIEATGVITRAGSSGRQVAFEARKVITYTRDSQFAPTAADALPEPILVCRAVANCVVPRGQQRRPRLVLPALTSGTGVSGSLPQAHTIVTPPPRQVITPPRSTPPEIMIAASIAGGGVTRDHSPHVPVTPEDAAREAKRCQDAGASIVYVGFRPEDPPNREFGQKARDFVDCIRATCDVIIVVSSFAEPNDVPQARRALSDSGADVVAIGTGSFNLGDTVVCNPRDQVRDLARSLGEGNVRVMLECLELGHVDEALFLQRNKLVAHPLLLQVILGVPGALSGHEDVIGYIAGHLPRGTQWFAAGVGRNQRPVVEAAARYGGNVRVGLADNIYLRRGVLADGSAPFVERVATYARSIGRDPVDASRARILLRFDSTADSGPGAIGPSSSPDQLDNSEAQSAAPDGVEPGALP